MEFDSTYYTSEMGSVEDLSRLHEWLDIRINIEKDRLSFIPPSCRKDLLLELTNLKKHYETKIKRLKTASKEREAHYEKWNECHYDDRFFDEFEKYEVLFKKIVFQELHSLPHIGKLRAQMILGKVEGRGLYTLGASGRHVNGDSISEGFVENIIKIMKDPDRFLQSTQKKTSPHWIFSGLARWDKKSVMTIRAWAAPWFPKEAL